MVQKEHPCIALPCVFILSMSVGVALTIVCTPFLSTGAVQVGAAASGLIVGIWFVILAGAWYKRSKDNLLWSLITTGLSWILLGAVISQMSQAAMIPFATLTCILLFFFSYKFIELNPETFIPIPRLTAAEVIPEYQQQYPYVVEPRRTEPKSLDSGQTFQPRFWRSWKGEVIRAIAEARTPLTLNEIAIRSKLDSDKALTVIKELHDLGVIRYESDHKYSVERGLYREYRSYIEENQRDIPDYTQPAPAPQRTGGHKHRTKNGEMVRSKSEVIVANTLARLGLFYEYEKKLYNPNDRTDYILPDFTIRHNGREFYWEHLGMLQNPKYKAKWEWKMTWYSKCGYGYIISRDGSDGSIDAQTIEATARNRILQSI